jgi:anthranilate phosphoribosyltransferase
VQLLGVYDRARTEMMAQALATVGTRRALVVAAWDGVDEISTSGLTQLSETDGTTVKTRHIGPEEFGVPRAPADAVRGGDPAMNADILRRILDGEASYYRDLVLVNAAAALCAAGKAASFLEGVETAAQAIDSGKARETLTALVEFTRSHHR